MVLIISLVTHWLAQDVDDHIDHGVVDNDDDDVGDIVDCDVVEHEADNLVVPLRTDDTDGKDGHRPRTNKSNTRFFQHCILRAVHFTAEHLSTVHFTRVHFTR